MEKRYDPKTTEPAMRALWEEHAIYRYRPGGDDPVYSIDTPPPTVSGSLHIGHIFSYVQAEMIARYKRMKGFRVFYPFGFDDNGLPTERLVEREYGVKAKDLPAGEFIARCMETAGRYEAEFEELWRSLGFSVDWSLRYRTISPEVQRLSQRSFLDLVEKGRAYEKSSPVLWCCECGTSIAQAELETREQDTQFHTVLFDCGDVALPVATTRPELLYGCVCLFIHPEDERYGGSIGGTATVPVFGHRVPILADETVDRDKGSGIVLCATFGDSTDAKWYEAHSLPYRRVLTPDGRIAREVPHLAGMTVPKARAAVLELLREREQLLDSRPISHTVGVHERCGTETEILPSRQWYIDILSEKDRFLAAADQITWYPAHMKKRYTTWVENLKWDWCISRQRYFGVPFPVWYCADCGKPRFAAEEQLPVDPRNMPCAGRCQCGCEAFKPETAVMDTWATSSLTPLINRERFGGELLPMGMRTQAHEIIRTWTFYTIVKSLYHTGQLPWKDVMICGFVLAKQGEKISKSKANSRLDPPALVREHSADALRYWAAGTRLGTDTFFDPEELVASRRFLTKLWNASRFAASHLEDYTGEAPERVLPVDRWILARTRQSMAEAGRCLDSYEIGLARHLIDELFWTDFCDYYLEIAKERLYQPEKHGAAERRSGQYALYTSLLGVLQLYAPFAPHITEAIYQACFRGREGALSLHLTRFPADLAVEEEVIRFGSHVKETVSAMRGEKSAQGLSLRAELPVLRVTCPAELRALYEESAGDLKACANAGELKIKTEQ